MRLEWPTDLTVNPLDNSLYVLDNNIVLQISESRRVRIIAGRPIHCQVPGIDHFIVSKVAIHSTLESARAIAVSHSGILYIAETDERKINRIQQVTTNGEISIIAGAPSDCDCKIDPNCDCFSGKTTLSCTFLLLHCQHSLAQLQVSKVTGVTGWFNFLGKQKALSAALHGFV